MKLKIEKDQKTASKLGFNNLTTSHNQLLKDLDKLESNIKSEQEAKVQEKIEEEQSKEFFSMPDISSSEPETTVDEEITEIEDEENPED